MAFENTLPVVTEDRLFPTLTPAQVARIGSHGRRRAIIKGDVLVEAGGRTLPFFVVVRGEIHILVPGTPGFAIALHPGQFAGEVATITGLRAVGTLIAVEAGELVELDREQLLGLIQTDTEL